MQPMFVSIPGVEQPVSLELRYHAMDGLVDDSVTADELVMVLEDYDLRRPGADGAIIY